MPALKNGRHEQFCQAFVAGPTAGNATATYKLVYGKENRSAASRLQHNRNVLNRVAELQNRAEPRETPWNVRRASARHGTNLTG
jgi:hypothetical protein